MKHAMQAAGIIALCVVAGGCASQAEDPSYGCSRGDITSRMSGDEAYMMNVAGEQWVKDAVVCKVGDLWFAAPADGKGTAYRVVRQGGGDSVVRLTSGDLAFSDVPYVHVQLSDQDHDGHFDSIGYDTWKWKGGRYLTATDWNLDGQADVRSIEQPDGSQVHEGWAAGAWREFTFVDGMRLVGDTTKRLKRNAAGEFEIVNVEQ